MKTIITLFGKLLILLLIMCYTSCSNDEIITPQQKYAEMYKKGELKGKTVNINIQFSTTYSNATVLLYDIENDIYINEIKGSEFNNNYELEYYHQYRFEFKRNAGLISANDEPYVYISIKNTTDNKIIDEFEREGCTIGYVNSFIVL